MIRREAVQIICKSFKTTPIIAANGFISRDVFEIFDKPSNFYMIGSMGLASSIGLGVALKNPKQRIFVFDGDGNILMNLGTITTIGKLKPKNLIHVVFDNESHESTGGQPTSSSEIRIEKLAEIVNYKTFKISSKEMLEGILKKIKKIDGPVMLLIKIEKTKIKSKRVNHTPIEIKNRFINSIKK